MSSLVDKTCTIRQTSTRYYLLNWVCKYVQLTSNNSVSTCATVVHIFSKFYIYSSFCVVYCHMLFRLCAQQVWYFQYSFNTNIYACHYKCWNRVARFFICVSNYQFTKILLHVSALVYTRSVSSYTTLIAKFCQTTKAKMFARMGFVNSYTAVTTNVNISN